METYSPADTRFSIKGFFVCLCRKSKRFHGCHVKWHVEVKTVIVILVQHLSRHGSVSCLDHHLYTFCWAVSGFESVRITQDRGFLILSSWLLSLHRGSTVGAMSLQLSQPPSTPPEQLNSTILASTRNRRITEHSVMIWNIPSTQSVYTVVAGFQEVHVCLSVCDSCGRECPWCDRVVFWLYQACGEIVGVGMFAPSCSFFYDLSSANSPIDCYSPQVPCMICERIPRWSAFAPLLPLRSHCRLRWICRVLCGEDPSYWSGLCVSVLRIPSNLYNDFASGLTVQEIQRTESRENE